MTETQKVQVQEVLPLSPLQAGMLHDIERAEKSSAYWNFLSFELHGNVDAHLMHQAWSEIVARHDAYRSSFVRDKQGIARQVVRSQADIDFHYSDLKSQDSAAVIAQHYEQELANRPKLNTAPLMRIRLYKTGENSFRLIWWVHHLIQDGWSCGIVLEELFEIYAAKQAGGEPALTRAPQLAQYHNYVQALENQHTNDEDDLERHQWQTYLEGAATNLPAVGTSIDTDLTSPVEWVNEHEYSQVQSDAIAAAAKHNGVTLSTMVHGAWAIALSLELGVDDVVFGVTTADRDIDLPKVDAMVGLLLSTTPARLNTHNQKTVRAWLQEHQLKFSEMRSIRAGVPSIARWVGAQAGEPLFNSLVVFENYPFQENPAEVAGLVLGEFSGTEQTSIPLTLSVSHDSALHIRLQVIGDARTNCSRLFERFCHILDSFGKEDLSSSSTAELCYLPAEVLSVSTASAAPDWFRSGDINVLPHIESVAQSQPNAIAYRFDERTLSYHDVWAQSDALASVFAQSVNAGERVGLHLSPCLELPLVILALWKIGASYVPIDINFPQARKEQIIEGADIRNIVIQDPAGLDWMQSVVENTVLLEAVVAASANSSGGVVDASEPMHTAGGAEAYVFFTSGSTGQAKGVRNTHSNVRNALFGMLEQLRLTPEDEALAITSTSFDPSVIELIMPLLAGSSIQIVAAPDNKDPNRIISAAQSATLIQATPTMWQMLLDAEGAERLPRGARALTGGELLSPTLAGRLQQHFSAVWNIYGPTETTIWALTHQLTQAEASPSIGKPIHGVSCHVIDGHGRLLPTGVVGELAIGGLGVGLGYCNNDTLTEAKFVTMFDEPVFKTGDLVTLSDDGKLFYRGRIDNQVKIRGFRIELEEIDSVVASTPGVASCCSLIPEDFASQPQIVTYFACENGFEPAAVSNTLETVSAEKLPDYMLPARFISLPSLPKTPTGKTDRKRLSALPVELAQGSAAKSPPDGFWEEMVAAQWEDLLPIKAPGRSDNFFALGGDSLTFAVLHRRLTEGAKTGFSLSDLYAAPTLADMARLCAEDTQPLTQLPCIAVDNPAAKLEASKFQTRLWIQEQFEGATGVHNIFAAYDVGTSFSEKQANNALELLMSKQDILRTRFEFSSGKLWQIIDTSQACPFEEVSIQADMVEPTLTRLAATSFALGMAPGWIVRLITTPTQKILMVCFHHIIADGYSVRKFINDFCTIYDSGILESGNAGKPSQFADFSTWQHALEGDQFEQAKTYWHEQLKGPLPSLSLPSFITRPPTQSFAGGRYGIAIEPAQTNTLAAIAAKHKVSLQTVVLTALLAAIQRNNDADEVIIGTMVTPRFDIDCQDVLGPIVNTLCLRLSLSDTDTLSSSLTGVSQTLRSALSHQHYPFEDLLQTLDVPRNHSHTPIFQILYSYQDAYQQLSAHDEQATGWQQIDVAHNLSRTDLSVFVTRGPDGIDLQFEYAADVYEPWLIEQLANHLEIYLQALGDLDLTQASLMRHPILPPDQYRSRVFDFQPQPQPQGTETTLDLVNCLQNQTKIAIEDPSQQKTYKMLGEQAALVAQNLAANSVARGSCVIIDLQRSADILPVMMGIWRVGAYFLPLGDAPEARRKLIIEDAGANWLIHDQENYEDQTGISLLSVDRLLQTAESAETIEPVESTSVDLAYIIYTSGSTGTPKGVPITHGALANFLLSMQTFPGINADDRLLAATTFGFDISILELFLPLTVGACVVMSPITIGEDPRQIADLLDHKQVTMFQATPSAWQLLLDSGWSGNQQQSLRAFVGGEALSTELANTLVQRCLAVYNLYGPTETTIWSTCAEVTGEGPVSLGHPIRNTQVYVVDQNRQPTPTGIAGELLIGGAGLSPGYWNRPELNAQKFSTHPFISDERVFNTGDLARWRPDGTLEFVGRKDFQTKLRGYRIELEEIDHHLRQTPGVINACTVVHEFAPNDQRLVAFIQLGEPEFEELQALKILRKVLPRYMVPQHFEVVAQFPTNASGKLDRSQLKVNNLARGHKRALQTKWQSDIAGIWANVLGLELDEIGLSDHFFELGGHSLLALHAVSAIEEHFGISISPARLLTGDFESICAELETLAEPANADSAVSKKSFLKRWLKW